MIRTFLSLALILVSFGALSQRKEKVKKKKLQPQEQVDSSSVVTQVVPSAYNVSVYIQYHYPYCGGAYPDPSEEYNIHKMALCTFVLINLDTREKWRVTTDSTGTLKLNLPAGRYGLKELYKDIPFDEFLSKYTVPISQDYVSIEEENCYENWWKSNFIEFTIAPATPTFTSQITLSESCFTGKNPCVIYMGPYPP